MWMNTAPPLPPLPYTCWWGESEFEPERLSAGGRRGSSGRCCSSCWRQCIWAGWRRSWSSPATGRRSSRWAGCRRSTAARWARWWRRGSSRGRRRRSGCPPSAPPSSPSARATCRRPSGRWRWRGARWKPSAAASPPSPGFPDEGGEGRRGGKNTEIKSRSWQLAVKEINRRLTEQSGRRSQLNEVRLSIHFHEGHYFLHLHFEWQTSGPVRLLFHSTQGQDSPSTFLFTSAARNRWSPNRKVWLKTGSENSNSCNENIWSQCSGIDEVHCDRMDDRNTFAVIVRLYIYKKKILFFNGNIPGADGTGLRSPLTPQWWSASNEVWSQERPQLLPSSRLNTLKFKHSLPFSPLTCLSGEAPRLRRELPAS